MTTERVTGVRRIGDKTATTNGRHHFCYAPWLRIGWMYLDGSCHARIVAASNDCRRTCLA
jgi:hypothetical protein